MANRHVIIKQIQELIADYEKELADIQTPVGKAYIKSQIRKLKQAIGLIK